MQQVSRKLLLAGVLAFGALTAACGDKVEIVGPPVVVDAVQSVTVSPSNATLAPGGTITLGLSVVTTGSAAKTVTWSSSNSAIASVDGTGKVTAPTTSPGGTVTILATSTVNTAVSGAAAIVVSATTPPIVVNPSIAINSVTDVFGNPVNLSNTNGQVNVSVNTSGGGLIEVFVSTSCATNTIGASDVSVATQQASSAQPGTVTLSFNTAQLITPPGTAPRFPNGNYCIKARLTNGTAVVTATNTTPITLNNTNQFKAQIQFVSQNTLPNGTLAPTSAVSGTNGLNYNQGNLTLTLNPVVFTSASPVALISGWLSKNGETAGVACTIAPATSCGATIAFTNQAVTNGIATVIFTDTGSTAGVRSIFAYQSLPAGDTLYITSATDAAGNPITVTPTPGSPAFVAQGGIRIDNDAPTLAAYVVTAPNGYIGAAYTFTSGTTGVSTDTKGPVGSTVAGVNTVTTTYYVGAANSTSFTAAANSCTVTGLTVATSATDLPNTTAINVDKAKVIVMDALGNKICTDVASTYVGGLFGVDKIAPLAAFTTATVNGLTSAADQVGYNITTKGFNTTFSDSISGFPQAAGSSPYIGTLKRNFYGTPSAADCVVGTYNAVTTVCDPVAITTANVPSFFETSSSSSASLSSSFQYTNGTNVNGYYTAVLTPRDVAGNNGITLTRSTAYDNVAPTVAAPTQSPAAVVALGSVTVSATAADNLNLTTSRANLIYAPITFARVTGNVLGTFGQFVTSATASATLTNVYRGMQDGSTGTITAGIVTPAATVTVTDVGGNSATSAASPIATSTAATAVFVGNTVSLASSATSGSATTNAATTNLTFQINGTSADPNFQSLPFASVDIYKLNTSTGEYAFVTSVISAATTDNTTTGARTYTYIASGVTLNQGTLNGGTAAATNTFLVVGRTAAGDAVRSPTVTQINN